VSNFLSELASGIVGSPATAALALVTLLAALGTVTLAVAFHTRRQIRHLLLVGLAVTMPIMTPMLVQSQKSAFFAMNLSVADLLVLPAILYLLLSLLQGNGKTLRLPLFWLFLAYLLWAAVSIAIGSSKLGLEIVRLANLVSLLKIAVLYVYLYLVLNLVDSLEDLRIFLKAWILTGTVEGLIGSGGALLYQIFRIQNFAAGDFRAMGTMGNPNMFAGYITTTFFFTYLQIALGGSRRFYVPCMITHGAAILLSASKGSVAAFLVGSVTLLLFLPHHRKKIVSVGATALLATAMLYAASEEIRVYVDRILSIADFQDKSHERRFALWGESLNIWQENALFGVGLGNFSEASSKEAIVPEGAGTKWAAAGLGQAERQLGVAHSTYLNVLCETGLPGLVLFLAIFLYFVFLLLARLLKAPPSDPHLPFHAAFLAAVMSWLAHAGVANVENSRTLWAALGLILAFEWKILPAGFPRPSVNQPDQVPLDSVTKM